MQNTVAALANKNNIERWKNVVNLEKFGQPATEFLIQALGDEDRWVRYLAADALANIGATHSVDHLISLLRDPDQDVRFAAAAALGKLGDPKAIQNLQEVLKKDNGYVKVAAEEALEKISPRPAGSNPTGSPSH
ncbi:MAG: HEAT repeat domain-containing protein [Methanomicrobiales archaeon HGW-Methanomicrobiales-1]|jgi:HEAT repeat protein|nr:MAG: HEAT repeat domain-containing protein [Methanomicrobiales archaeon HGW-Methanomicrobiales-1]